jgi:hypothetical protein
MPLKKQKKDQIEIIDDDEDKELPTKKAKTNQQIAFERRQKEMKDKTYSVLTMKLTSFFKTDVFTDDSQSESLFINTIRDFVQQVN